MTTHQRRVLAALVLAIVALAVVWGLPGPGQAAGAAAAAADSALLAPDGAGLLAGSAGIAPVLAPAAIDNTGPSAAQTAEFGADGSARGVARAVREATLSTRMAARITELPVLEGHAFEAGAVLVKFDCERQFAEARGAAAAAEAQRKMVETNEELDKFESIGKNDLSISRSQFEKARAESDALTAQLRDCKLYAPFAGRVVERIAHNHEAVPANQPLLRVVDTSELEIELIVPSDWLRWLAPGARFIFRIDETGHNAAGSVARLTPTVDPVSKSTKVIARLEPGAGTSKTLPGMSGTATFDHFKTASAVRPAEKKAKAAVITQTAQTAKTATTAKTARTMKVAQAAKPGKPVKPTKTAKSAAKPAGTTANTPANTTAGRAAPTPGPRA